MRNFQRMAVKQGEAFECESLLALECAGFEEIRGHEYLADLGIQLDAIATNQCGISLPWEFKGSLTSKRAGLLRTDTVKKALYNAHALHASEYRLIFPPLCLMTSHLPTKNDSFVMLDNALRQAVITDVVDTRNGEFLQWLAQATEEDIQGLLAEHAQFGMTCHPHMVGMVNGPRKRKMATQLQAKARAKKESSLIQGLLVRPP
jgi:hypothetical protein